jgi:WhiB family transcriptional regulator, redox-sensing transcriptional regulator
VTAVLTDLLPAGGCWRELGLCQQVDAELFFPEKGGSSREAKRVCSSCEVRAECLEFALANDEWFGVGRPVGAGSFGGG